MRQRARGLTLVEMLVILAVVLVLMMIFVPCGCPSREKARRTACLSNLKQIGQATSLYTQDYDGTLPWNPAPGGLPARLWTPLFGPSGCAPQPSTSFVTLLKPYLWHDPSFRCPSSPGYPASRHLGYAASLPPELRDAVGYGFNERLIGSPCRPRTVAALPAEPAALILFGDASQPWAGSPGVWVQKDGVWRHYWSVDPAGPERHEDGRSFLYADGRAKFLRPVLQSGDPDNKRPRAGYYPDARLE